MQEKTVWFLEHFRGIIMVSMLEVISRTEEKCKYIIENRKNIFNEVIEFSKNNKINEIVFVGSGSSYSTALTSMLFVEKACGIQTFVMMPNLFDTKENYNKNALYVFVSQSGTSNLTASVAKKVKNLGCHTLAICGYKDTPVAEACELYCEIACGYEEYSYSTLGFTTSALTEMLMGVEIGLAQGHINENKYNEYIDEAIKASESNSETIKNSLIWYEQNKEELLKAENFIFYGGSSLWGIANEGALKVMEITKKYVSVGYEMDDGMHGPNYCLDERTKVFALNDGKDAEKAIALMKLMKNEYRSGYMVGLNAMDNNDLALNIRTNNFSNIEIVSFIQVLAYSLATSNNTPIYTRDDPRIEKTKGKGYFNMHDVSKIK